MALYRIFIASFVTSILAFFVFIATYFSSIMNIIRISSHHEGMPNDPSMMLSHIFSPALIISAVIMGLAGLLNKVLGIVFVAKNKRLQGGEQALWIIGFIMFGFVTAIVFMALRKSRNLISEGETDVYKGDPL